MTEIQLEEIEPLKTPADFSRCNSKAWVLGSQRVPREEIVFFSQIIIIAIVVFTGLVNLTIGSDANSFWAGMVSGGVSALLPRPKMKKNKDTNIKQNPFVD